MAPYCNFPPLSEEFIRAGHLTSVANAALHCRLRKRTDSSGFCITAAPLRTLVSRSEASTIGRLLRHLETIGGVPCRLTGYSRQTLPRHTALLPRWLALHWASLCATAGVRNLDESNILHHPAHCNAPTAHSPVLLFVRIGSSATRLTTLCMSP